MYADYSFYKRKLRKKSIYYVRFRDPDTGKRLPGISTGKTNKGDADRWAREYLTSGKLNNKSTLLFSNYAKDWFLWNRCEYLKMLKQKGHSCSRGYADTSRGHLENHVLPYFGEMKLQDISVNDIESFLSLLSNPPEIGGKGLSSSSVNSIYQVFKTMLEEAYRKEYILTTPTERILKPVRRHKETGIIPYDKMRLLFDETTIGEVWKNNVVQYTLNLLSASTGMRQGEVQALKIANIYLDYVDVKHTWDRKYGLKPPKYNSKRKIPIPKLTSRYLQQLIDAHPYGDDEEALIFFGKDPHSAIDHKAVNKHFHRALSEVGIYEDVRKQKNISFHSWRHTFNSMMRTKIDDYKLRKMTGHKSDAMTDHYTHFSIDDYYDVAKIQNEIFT